MPITFWCSHCNGRMKVPNDVAGRRGKCAHCGQVVQIPAPSKKPGGSGGSDSGTGLTPVTLTESSERELVHSLVAATDTGAPELEHERLALERAKLEYDRLKLERAKRELEDSQRRRQAEAEEEDDAGLDEGQVEDALVECPACAEEIKARAKKCKHCGTEIRVDRRGRRREKKRVPRPSMVTPSGRTPGLAAVLSLLIIGLGQVYVGRVARGLIFMLLVAPILASLTLVTAGLGGIAFLVFYIWQIIDAAELARLPRSRWD